MTPEIIKNISKLRNDFYAAFAEAMEQPVKISGNSYNSVACIASWVDCNCRLNYLTIYAYLSPDALATDRPFILRLSINKGAGTVTPPRQGQMCQGINQQWCFEMTCLPEELFDFLPWIVDVVQAQGQGLHSFTQCPPHPISPDFYISLKSVQLWTLAAKQLVNTQQLVELPTASMPSHAQTATSGYRSKTTGLSSRRLLN